jgi:hypothetical protein
MGWIALEGVQEARDEALKGPGAPWHPSRQQRP